MIQEKEFKPYFDINIDSVLVVARTYQEERKGVTDLRLRTVHAEIYDKSRIETDDWKYNKHSQAEREATKNAFDLVEDGYNLIVWISPVSDIYEEGRLNIFVPKVENGKVAFDPWAVPLLLSQEKSKKMADKLLVNGGVSMDPINDVESLRRQPIGFKVEKSFEWIDKCRELMPEFMVIWDEIESGGVDKNMMKIAKKVEKAKIIARGNNYVFEQEMAKEGCELNVSGDHGGSWLSREAGVIIIKTPDGIQYRIGNVEGMTFCEKCGCWHSGDKCPCGR